MKPRRSMLFIPGANAAMLSTSFVYGADAVMFDLEDAVSLREKDTARLLVHHALQHPLYRDVETVVRINPLSTPFGLADLEAVVRAGVDMVRLPKTDSKEDIYELEAQVERIERECGREVGSTKLMAAIESALGVVNAVEIARASPRLSAIALAAFDYVMDMGTSRGDGTALYEPSHGSAPDIAPNCFTPAARCCTRRASPGSRRTTWCGRILTMKRVSSRKRIWRRILALTVNRWSTRARLSCCTRFMPPR